VGWNRWTGRGQKVNWISRDRAWLDGERNLAACQFFTTLRRDVHVIFSFDDSRAVEWFAAMDGNMFIVDEHAERLWLPRRHAPAIVAMLGRHQISSLRLEISDLKRFVAGGAFVCTRTVGWHYD
jgi:hypothetical protein